MRITTKSCTNDPAGRASLSTKRSKWEEQWNKVSNVPIDIASSLIPPPEISFAEWKKAHDQIRRRLSLSGSYPMGGSRAALQDIPEEPFQVCATCYCVHPPGEATLRHSPTYLPPPPEILQRYLWWKEFTPEQRLPYLNFFSRSAQAAKWDELYYGWKSTSVRTEQIYLDHPELVASHIQPALPAVKETQRLADDREETQRLADDREETQRLADDREETQRLADDREAFEKAKKLFDEQEGRLADDREAFEKAKKRLAVDRKQLVHDQADVDRRERSSALFLQRLQQRDIESQSLQADLFRRDRMHATLDNQRLGEVARNVAEDNRKTARISHLEHQQRENTAEDNRKTARISDLSARISDLEHQQQQQRDGLKEERVEVTQHVAQLEKELEQTYEDMEEILGERDETTQHVAQLEKEFVRVRYDIAEVSRERNEMAHRVTQLEQELERLREDIAEVLGERDEMAHRFTQLEQELERVRDDTQLEQAHEDIAKLAEQNEQQRKETASLEQGIARLEKELQNQRDQRDERGNLILELEKELQNERDQRDERGNLILDLEKQRDIQFFDCLTRMLAVLDKGGYQVSQISDATDDGESDLTAMLGIQQMLHSFSSPSPSEHLLLSKLFIKAIEEPPSPLVAPYRHHLVLLAHGHIQRVDPENAECLKAGFQLLLAIQSSNTSFLQDINMS